MTRRYTKQISLERIYERLLEESESNPMVLLVKQDCADAISACFGYNLISAYKKADEISRAYNLKLCLVQDLRGNLADRIKNEIGLTITINRNAYRAAINFIRDREFRGVGYDLHKWYKRYLSRKKKS